MPDTPEIEEETKKLQSNPFKKKSVAKHGRYDALSRENSLLELMNSSSNIIRLKTDSSLHNTKKRRATTFDSKKIKKTKHSNKKKKQQRSIFNFFS